MVSLSVCLVECADVRVTPAVIGHYHHHQLSAYLPTLTTQTMSIINTRKHFFESFGLLSSFPGVCEQWHYLLL